MLQTENINDASAVAGALKAQAMTAQGNVLGLESHCHFLKEFLEGEIVGYHPNCPPRSARGAFDNSPQFQLRVWGALSQFVPTGRLKFMLAAAAGCLGAHRFSRPGGANGARRTPPAVDTAGYCQFVPAGRETGSRRREAFLKSPNRSTTPPCSALSGREAVLTNLTQGVALGGHIPGFQPS